MCGILVNFIRIINSSVDSFLSKPCELKYIGLKYNQVVSYGQVDKLYLWWYEIER